MAVRKAPTLLLLLRAAAVVTATTFSVRKQSSAYAALSVSVGPGESIKTELGSLVTMTGALALRVKADRGLGSAVARLLAGEALYMSELVADAGAGGDALICPAEIGDIQCVTLAAEEALHLAAGAFLACDDAVEVTSRQRSSLSQAVFSGTGLRHLRVTGPGTCAFCAHGGLHRFSLGAGETRAVDNGHGARRSSPAARPPAATARLASPLAPPSSRAREPCPTRAGRPRGPAVVAWSPGMEPRVGWAAEGDIEPGSAWAPWARSIASGEGLMCFFEGPGEVWVQTHKRPEPARRSR